MPKRACRYSTDSSDCEDKVKDTEPKAKRKKNKTYQAKRDRRNAKRRQISAAKQQSSAQISTFTDTENCNLSNFITLSEARASDISYSEPDVSESVRQFEKLTINATQQTDNFTCEAESQCDHPCLDDLPIEISYDQGVQTEPNNFETKVKALKANKSDLTADQVKDELKKLLAESVIKLCDQYLETFSIDPIQFFQKTNSDPERRNCPRWDTVTAIQNLQKALNRAVASRKVEKRVEPVTKNQRDRADREARDQERRALNAELQAVIQEHDPAPADNAENDETLSRSEQRQLEEAIQNSLRDQEGPSGASDEPLPGPSGVSAQASNEPQPGPSGVSSTPPVRQYQRVSMSTGAGQPRRRVTTTTPVRVSLERLNLGTGVSSGSQSSSRDNISGANEQSSDEEILVVAEIQREARPESE